MGFSEVQNPSHVELCGGQRGSCGILGKFARAADCFIVDHGKLRMNKSSLSVCSVYPDHHALDIHAVLPPKSSSYHRQTSTIPVIKRNRPSLPERPTIPQLNAPKILQQPHRNVRKLQQRKLLAYTVARPGAERRPRLTRSQASPSLWPELQAIFAIDVFASVHCVGAPGHGASFANEQG